MERFEGACTDWTSYAEINRPNCLILGRFAVKQGANRFGRLILANQKLSPHASAVSDAPHSQRAVGSGSCAGRVRYSCLKEAARGKALMQIEWCWGDEKGFGNKDRSKKKASVGLFCL